MQQIVEANSPTHSWLLKERKFCILHSAIWKDKEMPSFIDKLAWIYIQDQRILSTRSKGKDTYYLPGGKRERGEADHEALLREIKEELEVDLHPATITFFGQFEAQAHGRPEGTLIRMLCYTADFSGEIRAASEVEEVAWLQYADKEKTSPVDQIIFDFLKEKNLIS
jgi:8-oxo-dGTP diphosphatase